MEEEEKEEEEEEEEEGTYVGRSKERWEKENISNNRREE